MKQEGNGHGIKALKGELLDRAYGFVVGGVKKYIRRYKMETRVHKKIALRQLLRATKEAFKNNLEGG